MRPPLLISSGVRMPPCPVLYAIFGYGILYIGESRSGQTRCSATLQERNWKRQLYYTPLPPRFDNDDERQHLEALIIHYIWKKLHRRPKSRAPLHLMNVQFTRTLGRFQDAESPPTGRAYALAAEILSLAEVAEDPRGNFIRDRDRAMVLKGAQYVEEMMRIFALVRGGPDPFAKKRAKACTTSRAATDEKSQLLQPEPPRGTPVAQIEKKQDVNF